MKTACGARAQVAETNHEVFMVEYLATRLKGSKDGKVPFPVSLSSPCARDRLPSHHKLWHAVEMLESSTCATS